MVFKHSRLLFFPSETSCGKPGYEGVEREAALVGVGVVGGLGVGEGGWQKPRGLSAGFLGLWSREQFATLRHSRIVRIGTY